jgi:hypothetical protein
MVPGPGLRLSRAVLASTATCCRSCAAYWHGLPRDRSIPPTREQLEHVVWVATAWLDVRLPHPPEVGQPVGGISVSDLPTIAELSSLDDSVINPTIVRSRPHGTSHARPHKSSDRTRQELTHRGKDARCRTDRVDHTSPRGPTMRSPATGGYECGVLKPSQVLIQGHIRMRRDR